MERSIHERLDALEGDAVEVKEAIAFNLSDLLTRVEKLEGKKNEVLENNSGGSPGSVSVSGGAGSLGAASGGQDGSADNSKQSDSGGGAGNAG